MLNPTTANPFAHTVSVDPKSLPAQPVAPKQAEPLIRDTWVSKPAAPTLIVPGAAPQPQAPTDWFGKLLDYVGMVGPVGPMVQLWKAVPQVAQDAGAIAQGLWGTVQGAWNTIAAWFTPQPVAAPAPVVAPQIQVAEPVPAAPVDLRTPEMLAEQETSIRRRFQVVLQREATAEEVSEYMSWLAKGAPMEDVHAAMTGLPEAKLVKLFKDEVGRDIDRQGRAFWMQELRNGEKLERIRERIRTIVGYGRDKYGMYGGSN